MAKIRSVLVYLEVDNITFGVAQMENGKVIKDVAMRNAYSMGLEIEQFLTGKNQSVDGVSDKRGRTKEIGDGA